MGALQPHEREGGVAADGATPRLSGQGGQPGVWAPGDEKVDGEAAVEAKTGGQGTEQMEKGEDVVEGTIGQ